MTTLEVVLSYFREAQLSPSAIDRVLNLPAGRAHDLIVGWWWEDKERAKKGRRETRGKE